MKSLCINDLKSVVDSLSENAQNVHASLFRVNKTKNVVCATKFAVSLGDDLLGHVKDVQDVNQKLEEEFEGVCEYKGEDLAYKLQWASLDSVFVKTVWDALSNAGECAEVDWVKNWTKESEFPKGFMLSSQYKGEPLDLLFNTPMVKQLKGKTFTLTANHFKVIDGPLLVLPRTIDALRVGERVYFLTKKGLALFSTPGEIVNQARCTVEEIVAVGTIGNAEKFMEYATSGHNPRRLLRYDKAKFEKVSDSRGGKKIRDKFGIRMEGGKLVVDSKEDAERLIKVICKRGMLDPFTTNAMEVSGAEEWR